MFFSCITDMQTIAIIYIYFFFRVPLQPRSSTNDITDGLKASSLPRKLWDGVRKCLCEWHLCISRFIGARVMIFPLHFLDFWKWMSAEFRILFDFHILFDFRSDAADKVVQEGGKFEELVVASNEVAASTAQLVSGR